MRLPVYSGDGIQMAGRYQSSSLLVAEKVIHNTRTKALTCSGVLPISVQVRSTVTVSLHNSRLSRVAANRLSSKAVNAAISGQFPIKISFPSMSILQSSCFLFTTNSDSVKMHAIATTLLICLR